MHSDQVSKIKIKNKEKISINLYYRKTEYPTPLNNKSSPDLISPREFNESTSGIVFSIRKWPQCTQRDQRHCLRRSLYPPPFLLSSGIVTLIDYDQALSWTPWPWWCNWLHASSHITLLLLLLLVQDVWPYLTSPCQTNVTYVRFGPRVGKIGHKWDKSWNFSDQIQYILAGWAKMY